MRRWLPLAIALVAAAAQIVGAPVLAFYLMLLAIPVLAACALWLFGDLLDARAAGAVNPAIMVEPLLSGLALLFVVAGTAAGSVLFALWGCLAAYALQTMLDFGSELRAPTALDQR
jgi:hypothetical protein